MKNCSMVHVSCLCRRVRLAVKLPAERIGHCHCVNCRRAQGAGVWSWATFPDAAIQFESGQDDLREYRSDTDAIRQFCGHCGSSLTYASSRWPGVIDLSLANFDEPLDKQPSRHSYADRAPDWCPILDDLPRLGGPTGGEPLD